MVQTNSFNYPTHNYPTKSLLAQNWPWTDNGRMILIFPVRSVDAIILPIIILPLPLHLLELDFVMLEIDPGDGFEASMFEELV